METTNIEAIVGELEQTLSIMEAKGLIKREGEGYIITDAGIDQLLRFETEPADTINCPT